MAGERGRAGGAVALAGEELRARPARVPGDPQADEGADRLVVVLVAVELLGVLPRRRAAPAGRDRIDEHQVGDVEEAVLVVDQAAGGRQGHPLRIEVDPFRPEGAEVHPQRRRARAAVVAEGDRPLVRVLDAVLGVGDVEEGGPGLPVLVAQHEGAGGGRVGDLLAAEGDGVLGARDLVLDGLLLLLRGRLGRLRLGGVLGAGGGGERQEQAENERDRQGFPRHQGSSGQTKRATGGAPPPARNGKAGRRFLPQTRASVAR